MAVCLLPEKIKEFQKALKDKGIKMEDLLSMGTEELTKTLEPYAGTNAKDIALLFEQKRILKNKLQGLKNAVSKIGEIGRYDPAKKAQIEQSLQEFRAQQQERIFNPKENETFYNALADKIMGTHITKEEAQRVFELSKKVEDLKANFDETKQEWTSKTDKANYGGAEVAYRHYVENLKGKVLTFKQWAEGYKSEFKQQFAENPTKASFKATLDIIKAISDNSISLVATLDNSFLGRQGLKTLQTHPSAWWDGAKNSFFDIAKTMKGENTMDALMADVYSDPLYMNGEFEKAGIIAKTEEQFPSSLPEKIPGVGRIFTASEVAFKGSALRMRIENYKLIRDIATSNGVVIDKAWIEDIGKVVNSLTARGRWGKVGESTLVKLIFWAPRMLKANLDVLTVHGFTAGLETSFAKKQAAINLLKIVGETAAIIMIANALKPGSAETDTRSSDFGKIKVGNTRFDYTGGAGSLITLASRLYNNASKSSTTGIVSEYGTGYGQQTRWDAFIDFATNKTTPPTRFIIDMMKGKNALGEKATLGKTLANAFTPIALQNVIQLKDNASADAVLGVLSDAIGISANTYQVEVNWDSSTSKEMLQFKNKLGDIKFKEANDLFNQKYSQWITKMQSSSNFQKLNEDDKKKIITNKKSEFKDQVFMKYGFIYRPKPSKPLPKF